MQGSKNIKKNVRAGSIKKILNTFRKAYFHIFLIEHKNCINLMTKEYKVLLKHFPAELQH